MAHLPEIPASAYTPAMDILGVIPDIPVFEGDRVLVSRNALTPGTRPLQLLPLPGFDFPVRHDTDEMCGFQSERHTGESCMTQLFSCEQLRDVAVIASSCVTQLFLCEQLRDAAVRSCAILLSLDFDFASFAHLDALFAVLKYASRSCSLEEQFHDATVSQKTQFFDKLHVDLGKARAGGSSTDASAFWDLLDPPMRSRVVAAGFGDYATGLRRTQPRFPPAMRYALMARWIDATHSFIFDLGEMTLTPPDFTAITRLGFDGEAVPLDSRYQIAALGAELVGTLLGIPTRTRYTARGYVSYEVVYEFWVERICTRLAVGESYPRMPDLRPQLTPERRGTRGSGESNWQFLRPLEVWAYEYRIYLGGPESDTSTEAQRIPRYLAHRHHTYSSSEDPHYWRCYLNDRALTDVSTRNLLSSMSCNTLRRVP
ncbi:hypothetical protein JCGZ_22186 [Jatropha curcas]|uniref:Aminotransferase-like plant mobile domain-containing protein n=1 Tax=Jatropha curcas TaxID=180498 RepID=A0A067K419_JATCU|nr:hypothetical protein JCGZ_22186 [Jatropha curcas]